MEATEHVDLAIVGGGPAGLAAARTARDLGIDALLLDERSEPDGGALVWGIWGTRLAYARGARAGIVDAGCVILATGSIDRSVVFPGWTIPGVVSLTDALAAGDPRRGRTLLVGSGPDLVAAAALLVEGGVELIAIVEAASTPRLRARDRTWLSRRAVPYRTSSLVLLGSDALESVVVARVDRDWHPIEGAETTYEAETLVLGYGRSAASEPARLAGCAVRYDEDGGGYLADRDEWLRTSIAGVLACGDSAGTGSRRTAELEGRLAAISAAHELGRRPTAEAAALAEPIRRRLARARRVDALRRHAYRTGAGMYELAAADTVLCRCESVTVGEVEAALEDGASDPNVVKVRTRAAMGICQARRCGRQLTSLVARRTGLSPGEVEPLSVRPPVKPVPISMLEDLDGPNLT
jgi:pyruvate/2-oxoglutarate dehydrogenase complex dihydrolipoamide dehydrogenase (E3) component